MYVQDTVYDKFIEILVGKAKQLVIGDGFDEKSGGGPVVSVQRIFLTRFLRLYAQRSKECTCRASQCDRGVIFTRTTNIQREESGYVVRDLLDLCMLCWDEGRL